MLIDLTRDMTAGMPVFPGDPEVRLAAAAHGPWQVTQLEFGSHTGTHADAACHRIAGGRTIDSYPLARFVLQCVVVRTSVQAGESIAWEEIAAGLPNEPAGCGVLLNTGWDRYWGTEDAYGHPFLSDEAARALVEAGVTLVGTDAFNVDDTQAGGSTVHEILLAADVLIVENLTNLTGLEGREHQTYVCAFLPLRLVGCDGSPVRACAWQQEDGVVA